MTRDGTAMVLPGVVAQGDRSEDPVTASRTPRTGTTKRNLSEILSKGLTTVVDLGSDELADGLAEGRASANGVEIHALPRLGFDLDVDRAGCGPAGVTGTPVGPGAAGSGDVGQYRSRFGVLRSAAVEDELGFQGLATVCSAEAPDPSGVDHPLGGPLHPPVHPTRCHAVERWRLGRAEDEVDDLLEANARRPATPPGPGRRGCRCYRPGDSSKAVWCHRGSVPSDPPVSETGGGSRSRQPAGLT